MFCSVQNSNNYISQKMFSNLENSTERATSTKCVLSLGYAILLKSRIANEACPIQSFVGPLGYDPITWPDQ